MALPVLAITAVVTAWNAYGAPQRIDDEGTYMAEAWAVAYWHRLAPYTYWYDHPPLGWLLIGVWTRVTDAFSWTSSTIYAGRALMVGLLVVSTGLLYLLARRLRLPAVAAGATALCFALSPLALEFHRYVYLDNVATPFVLGSFLLAARRDHIAAHAAAGVAFGCAVLCKETMLIFLPGLAWQLWQSAGTRTRLYSLTLAGTALAGAGSVYVLYAALKGELLPSPHHVSLLSGIDFQLAGRQASGSIFPAGTLGHHTVALWLHKDWFILAAGLLLAPAAACQRSLLPAVTCLLAGAVTVLTPGYLPVPFIIGSLPFACLAAAGGVYTLASWKPLINWHRWGGVVAAAPRVLTAAGLITAMAWMVPSWIKGDSYLLTADADRPEQQALAWVSTHVPRYDRLLVDDSEWVDLVRAGFPPNQVVWFYKLSSDPSVEARYPRGWHDLQYVIVTYSLLSSPHSADVADAIAESAPVAAFGNGQDRVTVNRICALRSMTGC